MGSLGVGADVGFNVSRSVGIRLGANFQPMAVNVNISDVDVRGEPASPSFTGFLDLHPGGGGFRITGGAVLFAGSHTLHGTPTGTVEFGGVTYNANGVGTLSATIQTRSLAPYAGIGWGGATRSGFGLSLDLGVAMHGAPRFAVDVDGILALDSSFRADLDREVAAIEEDAATYNVYPVLSIGLSYGSR